MNPESIVDLFRQAMEVLLVISSVLIAPGLCVGLLVSIFQAATQINEQTLSFVPKLFVTFGTLLLTGPWLINYLTDYTSNLFQNIIYLIG